MSSPHKEQRTNHHHTLKPTPLTAALEKLRRSVKRAKKEKTDA